MYRLSLDSCTKACSVSLFDLDDPKADAIFWFEILRQGHAELMAAKLEALMLKHHIMSKDIDHLCVTTGPGTFTGARIALSFARMFAKSRNLPIIPIDSLTAIAFNAVNNEAYKGRAISVAIDARREQVYFARFTSKAECVLEPKAINIETAQTLIQKGDLLLGTGAALLSDDIEVETDSPMHFPNASIFGKYVQTSDATEENISPLYLRAADAKLPEKHPIRFT